MTQIESTHRLTLNSPGVVCDVVADEVVFVHLESGAYYSTEGAGAAIWQLLAEGRTVEETVRAIGTRYSGDPVEIERSVHAFVDQLLAESLVRADGDGPTASCSAAEDPAPDRPPFPGVVFQKYVDLEELLLLDPIHEVDESGWPHPKKP
jgi:hypothetical protein